MVLLLFYVAAVTPGLCATDLLERRLPNRLVVPGYLVAAVGLGLDWAHSATPPTMALVSGGVYFSVMLAFGLAGGMGMGDVKLAGVLGLAAGALGPGVAIASPAAAFGIGGVAAVVALARGSSRSIPFGPFLLAGFWVAALVVSPGGSST